MLWSPLLGAIRAGCDCITLLQWCFAYYWVT